MISTEARFALPEPTARSKAFVSIAGKPGTFFGEAARSLAQFKAFTISLMYMHWSRIAFSNPVNKLSMSLQLVTYMTLAGAFAEQMSSLSRGQDPRDMTDSKFWVSAVARGGSLGPVGDVLFSDTSRYGHGYLSTLSGPLVGAGEDLGKLTIGNVIKAAQGKDTDLAHDLRKFSENFLPGNSLWYFRLLLERYVKDQLEQVADPKAKRRYRDAEKRVRKEYGQKFWWSKGKAAPNRLPDFKKSVGD